MNDKLLKMLTDEELQKRLELMATIQECRILLKYAVTPRVRKELTRTMSLISLDIADLNYTAIQRINAILDLCRWKKAE